MIARNQGRSPRQHSARNDSDGIENGGRLSRVKMFLLQVPRRCEERREVSGTQRDIL